MAKRGHCRICEFWKKYPYKVSDKELFEAKAREGVSLRKLELLLEAIGLKAKKDLIAKHIKVCMNVQVAQQRQVEKEIKRKGIGTLGQKLKGFFIRPSLPSSSEGCEHKRTRYSFDHNYSAETSDGLVWIVCLDCHKVVRKFDPEESERRMKRNPRNLVIYEALRRKNP